MEEYIGERIARIRITKGYTQKEVCEKLGVATGLLGQYERGIRNPKLSMLRKLADVLEISLYDLIENTKDNEPFDCKHKKVYKKKRRTKQKKYVLNDDYFAQCLAKRNMSIEDFAKVYGVSRQRIYQILDSKTQSLKTILHIAEIFSVDSQNLIEAVKEE